MTRLAGYPSGLLSLLGSQNFGDAPKDLSPVISPVVSIEELYLVSAQRMLAGVLAGGVGGFNSIPNGIGPVPQGELWRVVQISGLVITPAGNTLTWMPALRLDGAVLILADPVDQIASTTRLSICKLTCPLWLPAGSEIGMDVFNLVGGPPTTMAIQLLFDRLRA